MLSGNIRTDVDRVWDLIWSSGVSNPLTCVEYISVLLAATRSDQVIELEQVLKDGDVSGLLALLNRIHEETGLGSRALMDEHSPWTDLATVRASYEMLRDLQVTDRNHDIVGDIFEYVLSKLSTAGRFGQFRTPRHIIQFIVDAVGPRQGETILDPACGTGGFLIAAEEYVSRQQPASANTSYVGYEVDTTVARLARSNLFLHDISNSQVRLNDSLAEIDTRADVVLANPPFSGLVSKERADSFKSGSSKTELLFLEQIMNVLRAGGRAGVVVPFGVLTSTNTSSVFVRRALVSQHGLRAVIELPPGVFRPYTDVRTALLFWTGGETVTDILFARANADGYSLDDRRTSTDTNDLPRILRILNNEEAPDGRVAAKVSVAELDSDRLILNPSAYLESSNSDAVPPARTFDEVLADIQNSIEAVGELALSMKMEHGA